MAKNAEKFETDDRTEAEFWDDVATSMFADPVSKEAEDLGPIEPIQVPLAGYPEAEETVAKHAEALRSQGEYAKASKAEKEAARVFKWASEWRREEDLEDHFERIERLEEQMMGSGGPF